MIQADKLAKIKEKLVKIANQDLTEAMRARAAVRKMMDLGYTPARLTELLAASPVEPGTVFDNEPFMGFASRAEATMASVYAMSITSRPGIFHDASRRIEMLMKAQEPERAATTIGLAVVSVPAMMAPAATVEVKRFRRTADGQLKAITDGGVLEMEEAQESVFTVKRPDK